MSHPSTLDLESLWGESLASLLNTINSGAQRHWLASTHPVGFSDDTVVLASPHSFARDWLERSCGEQLRSTLSSAAGRPLNVVITIQTNPEPVDRIIPGAAADQTTPTNHAEPGTEHPANPVDEAPTSPSAAMPIHTRGTDQVHTHGTDATQIPGTGPVNDPATANSSFGTRTTGQPPVARSTENHAPDDHGGTASGAWNDNAVSFDTSQPLQAPGRPAGPTVELPQRAPAQVTDLEPDTQLNPKYLFDDFVIGSSNRFAHAAATAVAEAPAKSYNPLFIYGGAGLGKTHLLHAIGHYVRNLYPRLQVRYVTTEQFTNEFINGIRDDQITAFQRRYRRTDVLLIDDIQFLQQKERTQEEFFHTFNALHNAEKQIVISSDRPPKQIAQLEDRLRSRFEWGLMTDVQPPDLETRIAILRKKSESDRLPVGPDVLELIASRVQSNIRELEGALIRVSAFASLQRAPADSSMAESVLKDLFPDGRDQAVSVQLIMTEVADYYSLTVDDLCSQSRSRQLVQARQIAMYLTRELTELSLPRIGKAFGGRDHTTVMHAKSKIAGLMQERQAIYDQVQELTNRVKTRARTA